jgi:hypothetical protein
MASEERLRLWKNFRDGLNTSSQETRLTEVAKFCFDIPYGTRTLDYFSPVDWPTPWEILFYGSFCTSSISLLIFYTLTMIDNPEIVELYLVEDDDGQYLLPVIDNQFVLNYELGQVSKYSELCDSFKVLQQYSKEKIKNIT